MAVAPVLSLAAVGMSAAGSLVSAQGQAKANEQQAQQALDASLYGRIKAAETGTIMTRNMQAMLGHIQAVRASVGSDPRSPTTAAIMASQEGKAQWQRGIELGNVFAQVRSDEQASRMYTDMASRALMGGYMGAAGGLLKGFGGAFQSWGQ